MRRGSAASSRNPPEPERRQCSTCEQERGCAAREVIADLSRLLPGAEARSELLVDTLEPFRVGGGEELASRELRDLPERVGRGRDTDDLPQAAGECLLDDALRRPHQDAVDRYAKALGLLGG